jgi:hypothetical protein
MQEATCISTAKAIDAARLARGIYKERVEPLSKDDE